MRFQKHVLDAGGEVIRSIHHPLQFPDNDDKYRGISRKERYSAAVVEFRDSLPLRRVSIYIEPGVLVQAMLSRATLAGANLHPLPDLLYCLRVPDDNKAPGLLVFSARRIAGCLDNLTYHLVRNLVLCILTYTLPASNDVQYIGHSNLQQSVYSSQISGLTGWLTARHRY